MLIQKLKYGAYRIYKELFGKEDYWHVKLSPIVSFTDTIYFHNFEKKGYYPGELDNGIPIFYLNGTLPVRFHITTLNYGLGLLHRHANGEDVAAQIKDIVSWLLESQEIDGSWRYNFPVESRHKLADNKPSGMTQGLAISFLIRAKRAGFIKEEEVMEVIIKAVQFLESDEVVSVVNGNKFIEEFYVPGDGILNGAVFALYGLYDYGEEINDQTKFLEYLSALKVFLGDFSFLNWTYYDLKGTVASKFYHQLHIDMMTVLFRLTNDKILKEYADKWEKGRKLSVLFVFVKAFQKIKNINSMVMSHSGKR